jgi:hypothetical protein
LTSADESRRGSARAWFFFVGALLACVAATPHGWQTLTTSTAGGVLRVHASSFDILEGAILDWLRDGRSVRLDFELGVLAEAGGTAVAQSRQSFNVSFDLWEERFAATHVAAPARSVSHLDRKATEAWCLDHLTVPLGQLARFGRTTPFWVRLSYRVPDVRPAVADDDPFTLQTLIDALSRKRRDNQPGKSVEAGPFHLSN